MSAVAIDPRLRERRVKVLRAKGRRRLRLLIGLAMLATCVVLFLWLVRSPLLDVDEVQVQGNQMTSNDEILQAAAVDEGLPLVDLDLTDARAAVAQLPWVQDVYSSRNLDGTIEFSVTERVPVAAVLGAGEWMLVDASGRILEITDEVPAGVGVVMGDGWTFLPGGWVSEAVLGGVDVAADLPAALERATASVQVRDSTVELVLFGGGTVVLGQSVLGESGELDAKFLAALTVLEHVEQDCLERLDVRVPTAPVLTRVPNCP